MGRLRKKWADIRQNPQTRLLAVNVLAQGLSLGSIPFITRVFEPATVGVWGTVIVSVNLIWSFSQLRADLALFQAETETEKRGLFDIGLSVHTAVSLLCLGGFILWGFPGTNLVYAPLFAGAAIFANGWHQMGLQWLASERRYDALNALRLAAAALTYPGALLGYLVWGENSLLLALLAGSTLPVGVFLLCRQLPVPFRSGQWRNFGQILQKHSKTTSLLPVSNLLSAVSDQALVLLVAWAYSGVEAAACFMAMRMVGLPLSMIQAAVSQYNYRHFQDLYEAGTFGVHTVFRHWLRWLMPALLFFVPVLLFGPALFAFILGKEWTFAGEIAGVLSGWAFLKFLNNPTSMGYFTIGRQEILLRFTVLLALTLPVVYLLALEGASLRTVMLVFAALQSGILMIYNVVMLRLIHRKTRVL